jgi:hypothetical protein
MRRHPLALASLLLITSLYACKRGDADADRRSRPGRGPAAALAPAGARLDMISADTDPNGFLINPRWVMQAGGKLPNVESECGGFTDTLRTSATFLGGCTTQASAIEFIRRPSYTVLKHVVCAADPDHVNWRVGPRGPAGSAAVAVGSLYLDDVAMDGDLDFFLRTPGDPGRTASDPYPTNAVNPESARGVAGMELEFLLKEVDQRFETEFWTDLIRVLGPAGGGNRLAEARTLVNGRNAVAMGVFGVDGVHGAHSEIHPVFSLAIRTVPGLKQDIWTIFARNWGSEGECSPNAPQRLTVPGNRLLIWIPWRRGATGARLAFLQHRGVVWRNRLTAPPIAVPLTFPSGKYPFVEGELEVEWSGPVVDDTRLDEPGLHWKRRQLGDEQILRQLQENR